jgi:hypothetical protein
MADAVSTSSMSSKDRSTGGSREIGRADADDARTDRSISSR